MHTIHNARIQLLAAGLNNLGVGCVLAGIVAPLLNSTLGDLAHIGAWLVFGTDLVAMGYVVRGRLR